jgi:hypothetical protein
MPVKAISIRAVQVMIDLIRDVLEKVMDEAATCADRNGRVIIDSGYIKTGSQLALQKHIDTFCPHMKMAMALFASQRFADYYDYLFWEQKQAEASALGVPSIPPPDRPRPASLRLRPLPNRFVADHLRGVRGIRLLTTWDY